MIAGIAGALYVPQAGIINPSEMNPVNSIEMAVWVAAGGRGTLIGPILGAGLINAVKTYLQWQHQKHGYSSLAHCSLW